jgi:hypothetical protein
MAGRWHEPAGEYTFFYGKGNEKHEIGKGFLHKKIISAVETVGFVIDRLSQIILILVLYHSSEHSCSNRR